MFRKPFSRYCSIKGCKVLSYPDLSIIAFSVSLDAFAVALCCGLVNRENVFRSALLLGLVFGGFQAVMPLTGWGILYPFAAYLKSVGPYVMLILLNIIGVYMIYESFSGHKVDERAGKLTLRYLLLSGIAVSVDAGGIGASLAVNQQSIVMPVIFMGGFTCGISAGGYCAGRFLGHLFERKLEFLGGTAIILIGWKLFFEALGYF
ncbi:MAG: manganese efflux pump MntP family protein [Victivallaceae bacterium]|nr:manganese efflux pump MntP family protein [Victivallaceae bacterium]